MKYLDIFIALCVIIICLCSCHLFICAISTRFWKRAVEPLLMLWSNHLINHWLRWLFRNRVNTYYVLTLLRIFWHFSINFALSQNFLLTKTNHKSKNFGLFCFLPQHPETVSISQFNNLNLYDNYTFSSGSLIQKTDKITNFVTFTVSQFF